MFSGQTEIMESRFVFEPSVTSTPPPQPQSVHSPLSGLDLQLSPAAPQVLLNRWTDTVVQESFASSELSQDVQGSTGAQESMDIQKSTDTKGSFCTAEFSNAVAETSKISAATIDELGRLVINEGRNALKIPDLSVVHPLLTFGSDTLIALVENKFTNRMKAVTQLRLYAKDHHQNSPRMWCFAFVLTHRGLWIAMFRFKLADCDDLVAISEDPEADGKQDAVWYPATHAFVHASMVQLLKDVCEQWELQWLEAVPCVP